MIANRLYDALFARGEADAPALEAGALRLTYAELADQTARWAGALAAAGVRPGDRIAVQIEKSAANLLLYLGALRAGAVYLPLNPAYTPAELAYFIGDAEPALIVCDPARRDATTGVAGGVRLETLDAAGQGSLAPLVAAATPARAVAARGPADLAAICYTSGTTGRSKGAMLTHEAMASNAEALTGLWRFSPADVLIHALPLYHVHGLFVATHVSLMAGASMILQPKFDAGAVLAAAGRASVLMGVPTFYTRLLAQAALSPAAVAGMRLFVSGSAPLLPQTHQAWRERTGAEILERYGMTETGMNTSNPYDGPRLAGSVGMPLPGVSLRVVSQEGERPLAPGETGMVQVRGPNLFAGYWRNPEKTQAAFTPDGWFRTGDLGRVDADGRLWLAGRSADLIISGGLNVYPAEIEAAIDQAPGVAESAVIGLPHPDLGEAVTAIVVPGADRPAAAAIDAALAERLAGFKRPKRILFAEALPRNAMGKVVKAALRAEHAGLYDAALEPRAGRAK